MKPMKSQNKILPIFVLVGLSILGGCAKQSVTTSLKYSPELDRQKIVQVVDAVADWKISHQDEYPPTYLHPTWKTYPYNYRNWVQATLYTGMSAWAEVSENPAYQTFLTTRAHVNNAKMGDRVYHADDHLVGELYLYLHAKSKDESLITPLKKRFDYILENKPKLSLAFNDHGLADTIRPLRWNWADSIYMSPPIWAHLSKTTGDPKYLNFMIDELRVTTEYLFDQNENLYYRDDRFFTQRESNGEKVFWSRGNGWVIAGLARVLEYMPNNHPARKEIEVIFKKMAAKIITLQQPSGFWHASLLDPKSVNTPESSGTGFFAYALAWGINNGLLDKTEFLVPTKKAWQAIVSAVHSDGKLGWVQKIGASPESTSYESTELYGVGAFLMAGTQMYKLAEN